MHDVTCKFETKQGGFVKFYFHDCGKLKLGKAKQYELY